MNAFKVAAAAAFTVIVVASVYCMLVTSSNGGVLRVATTTSLYYTGLLDRLVDDFSRAYGITIHLMPLGSGQSLELASRGDVDVVLSHAPNLEKRYLDGGFLVEGRIFAFNYFVVLGPKEDPAKISGLADPVEAFKRIYDAGLRGEAVFVSRGDRSGTHERELALWREAGLNVEGCEWYLDVGSNMVKALLVSDNLGAYTLSDVGTYIKLRSEGAVDRLVVLINEGEELVNVYSAYIVNPNKFKVNYGMARLFVEFLTSDECQAAISSYGMGEYGLQIFHPAKGVIPMLTLCWQKQALGG
ncbi:MAG: substrate-binding domain-containing protein [Candidatus Nezhaarchaeota archaeon]|nr:substrate-binding domain-containing protein [Candidatus Nezhaarchaeota archaeon]